MKKALPIGSFLLALACDSQVIAEMDFCPEYARVECSAVKGACGVPDVEACVAQRDIDCQQRSRKWLVGAKGYNALGARACIDRMQAVYRQAFIPAADWRDVDQTCQHSYFGHRRRGELCEASRECGGQDHCRDRVCLSPAHDSAAEAVCPCPAGQVCDQSPETGLVCSPLNGPGGRCTYAQRCRDEARCQMGTCVARTALGGECFEDWECVLPSAFCDPASYTCKEGFAVTPQAQFCQPYLRARPSDGGSGDRLGEVTAGS